MTITARPEYNGTEVVCVALFFDGSPDEQTEPATLLGIAKIIMLSFVDLHPTIPTYSCMQCLNFCLYKYFGS